MDNPLTGEPAQVQGHMDLRHVVLDFKHKPVPKTPSALYQAESRKKLKQNPRKWTSFQERQKQYMAKYMQNLSDEAAAQRREKRKLQQRERRKAQREAKQVAKRDKETETSTSKKSTPAAEKTVTRTSLADTRNHWKNVKRVQRAAVTSEEKKAHYKREYPNVAFESPSHFPLNAATVTPFHFPSTNAVSATEKLSHSQVQSKVVTETPSHLYLNKIGDDTDFGSGMAPEGVADQDLDLQMKKEPVDDKLVLNSGPEIKFNENLGLNQDFLESKDWTLQLQHEIKTEMSEDHSVSGQLDLSARLVPESCETANGSTVNYCHKTRIDAEALITAVEKRNVLYDKMRPHYNNRKYVEAQWKKIAKEVECDAVAAERSWKELCDYFLRCHSEMIGSAGSKKKKWHLYDRMQFILPHIMNGDISTNMLPISSDEDEEKNEDSISPASSSSFTLSQFNRPTPTPTPLLKNEGKQHEPQLCANPLRPEKEQHQKPHRRRQRLFPQQQAVQQSDPENEMVEGPKYLWKKNMVSVEMDEDELFFKSLIPKMKLLGTIDKMKCEAEIHLVVLKYLKRANQTCYINHQPELVQVLPPDMRKNPSPGSST